MFDGLAYRGLWKVNDDGTVESVEALKGCGAKRGATMDLWGENAPIWHLPLRVTFLFSFPARS
ncbi:hypothetical protein ABIC08_007724 [Bradyrhizobium sp. RT9b]